MATAYVAAYLDHLGITPDGKDGSWFQEFEFPAGAKLGPANSLFSVEAIADNRNARNYLTNNDWLPLTFSKTGKTERAGVVFVGYGIEAAEADGQPAYSSYGGMDVKGKWVMMLRYCPEDVDDNRRQHLQYHSSLRKKAMVAREKGPSE